MGKDSNFLAPHLASGIIFSAHVLPNQKIIYYVRLLTAFCDVCERILEPLECLYSAFCIQKNLLEGRICIVHIYSQIIEEFRPQVEL